jgi:hypothetical protein
LEADKTSRLLSGRGCVKTRLRSVFGSIKTPPHHKQIEYSAFYEVVFDDTSFRAEFLHGLGRVEMWRGDSRSGIAVVRRFRLAVPQ